MAPWPLIDLKSTVNWQLKLVQLWPATVDSVERILLIIWFDAYLFLILNVIFVNIKIGPQPGNPPNEFGLLKNHFSIIFCFQGKCTESGTGT